MSERNNPIPIRRPPRLGVAPEAASTPKSSPAGVSITSKDIVFDCPSCGGELVVDRAGEGMSLTCSHCGVPIVVPAYRDRKNKPVPAGAAERGAAGPGEIVAPPDFAGQTREQVAGRVEDLRLQLQENEAQQVEIRGHINRTTLQLHRYQLQMDKLGKRQRGIEAELKAALDRLKAV